MSFKTLIKKDSRNCLFRNRGEFTETVTYTPSAGAPKSIEVIVNRKRLDPADEDSGRVLLNQIDIYIANDSAYGVTSINKGFDKVSLPAAIGGTAIDWVVVDIMDQDEGIWKLLLQK